MGNTAVKSVYNDQKTDDGTWSHLFLADWIVMKLVVTFSQIWLIPKFAWYSDDTSAKEIEERGDQIIDTTNNALSDDATNFWEKWDFIIGYRNRLKYFIR